MGKDNAVLIVGANGANPILENLVSWVRDLGNEVFVAKNANDALRQYILHKQKIIDLVVCNLDIQEETGNQAIAEISEDAKVIGKSLRIITLTTKQEACEYAQSVADSVLSRFFELFVGGKSF